MSASLGVPFTERAPRLYDVGLFMCVMAMEELLERYTQQQQQQQQHTHPACTRPFDDICAWCLRQVAFVRDPPALMDEGEVLMQNNNNNTAASSPPSSPMSTSTATSMICDGEINFSAAMRKLHTSSSSPSSPGSSGHVRRGDAATTMMMDDVGEEEDDGWKLLVQWLRICHRRGGAPLCTHAMEVLLHVLNAATSTDARAPHAALARFFQCDDLDQASIRAIGCATMSFRVWIMISWACASFRWQNHLAATVAQRWLSALHRIYASPETWMKDLCGTRNVYDDVHVRDVDDDDAVDISMALAQSGKNRHNLQHALQHARQIFEGHADDDCGGNMMEHLFSHNTSPQLPESIIARLLASQGPEAAAAIPRQELLHRGTQPILYHITCGMLLYVHLHLSMRALNAARQCANAAVLVGQQLQTSDVLSLAQFSRFLLLLSTGRALEAAYSISIALQLAQSSSSSSSHDGRAQTSSMCFIGAAQLLIFFPGAVSASLRSSLAHAQAHLNDDSSNSNNNNNERVGTVRCDGPTVVVENIAQTVRQTLRRSAIESLSHTSPAHAWAEEVSAISRDTMRILATMYGAVDDVMELNTTTMHAVLRPVMREAAYNRPGSAATPLLAMLGECTRHTAHKALAHHEGLLPCLGGRDATPLNLIHHYVDGVAHHVGASGVALVQENFFLTSVVAYLVCGWQVRHGRMSAAYDGLTELIEHLFTATGVEVSSLTAQNDLHHVVEDGATPNGDGDQRGSLDVAFVHHCDSHKEDDFFWPPDHLLLFGYVQYKRAEVAAYLGYTHTIRGIITSLRYISANNSFVFGVLLAELVEVLLLHMKGNYSAVIDRCTSVRVSAQNIGLKSLEPRINARCVAALMRLGRWRDALGQMDDDGSPSASMRAYNLIARFNAGMEMHLRQSSSSTSSPATHLTKMKKFVEEGVRVFIRAGIIAFTVDEVLEHVRESGCLSIHEVLSACTAAARGLAACSNDGQHDERLQKLVEVVEKLCAMLADQHHRLLSPSSGGRSSPWTMSGTILSAGLH